MLRRAWSVAVMAISLTQAGGGNAAEPEPGIVPPWAQARDPDEVLVFKTTPQGDLKLNIYRPQGWKAEDRRPAIVFWFGGGFTKGTIKAFSRQSSYFATRGLVCVCAEYRIKDVHGTDIDKCVEDARSAMRWVKGHASQLGIAPEKIIAAGGSAGGTLALSVALADGPDAKEDDLQISTRPCALILFNPAQGPAIAGFGQKIQGTTEEKKQVGDLLSAIDRPRSDQPPTIMFFGTDDRLLGASRDFCGKAQDVGARCELWTAEGQGHSFFNRPPWYSSTLRQADVFLGSLGYVQGEPTIPATPIAVLKRLLPASETPASPPPPRDTSRLTPLPDLGTGRYQEFEGGLYPEGRNDRPAEHEAAGVALAAQVRPLDAQGRPADDGKIVLLGIGFSNTVQAFNGFQEAVAADHEVNPHLVLVNGAVGGRSAAMIQNPDDQKLGTQYWATVDERLQAAHVTREQVQAVWIKETDPAPHQGGFPKYTQTLERELTKIVQVLPRRFPNARLAYLSSRTYGGWAMRRPNGGEPGNSEPFSYESGFAVKWLLQRQIAGDAELNFAAARGDVKAPWLSWAAYLWTNGATPRKDGVFFDYNDFSERDRMHESPAGQKKVGGLLLKFFKTDATTRPWFVNASN